MKDVTVHTGLGRTWLAVHPTNSDNLSANLVDTEQTSLNKVLRSSNS